MKKQNSGSWRNVLNSYTGTTAEPTAKTAPKKKERFMQPYEQTGKELQETLSPEFAELLQLHRGRPRSLQAQGIEVRTSFILNVKQLEKLRAIASREGSTLKAVVSEAFENAIRVYEQRNGELTPPTIKTSVNGLFAEE